MTDYFNTTCEADPAEYNRLAQKQDQMIYEYFSMREYHHFSPSQIWRLVFNEAVPLTSVRRAMSNLTAKGLLVKTEHKTLGPYGRPEYLWRLAVWPATS